MYIMKKHALYATILTHIISSIGQSMNMSIMSINIIIYVNKKKSIFFVKNIFPIV